MTPNEIAKQLLFRAAEIIREHGWTQGEYRDDSGRHCLIGALLEAEAEQARVPSYLPLSFTRAANRTMEFRRAERALDAVAMHYSTTLFTSITTFNDEELATGPQAASVLRRAAYSLSD